TQVLRKQPLDASQLVRASVIRIIKRGAIVVCIVVATLLAGRAWQSQQGPALHPWHTHVPAEMKAREIAASSWTAYLAKEQALFDDVRANVTDKLSDTERVPSNRYFAGSPLNPGRFTIDWNRSYALEPAGRPAGAVVLVHGLTDSPYSLRHVALR